MSPSCSCSTNGLRPHDHVSPTFKELHWLPIKQRVDYKLCLLVHKVVDGHAPSYLTDMLTAVTDVLSRSTLRDASNGDYVVPRTRLKFGERAFSVAAPQAWNRLPTELKLMRSTSAFKRCLKKHSSSGLLTVYSNRTITGQCNRLSRRFSCIGGALNQLLI